MGPEVQATLSLDISLFFLDIESIPVFAPSFEAVDCFICGRQRVVVARYRMMCLVLAIGCFSFT